MRRHRVRDVDPSSKGVMGACPATSRPDRAEGAAHPDVAMMPGTVHTPSAGERRKAAVLRRRLTPDVATHRRYLRQVAACLAQSRAAPLWLAHDGDIGRVTALQLWRSRLFGRRYLVAGVDPSWYRAAAPASHAMTSTLSGLDAAPPLVIVPGPLGRRRREDLRAIVEHEFVHVNQALLGTLLPSRRGPARQRLAELFVTRLRNEYEAHLLQATRWPHFFPHGLGLSLPHWCALRGYTDALEAICLAAWRGEVRPRDLPAFLDRLPGRLGRWLRTLGLGQSLASWFQRHLVLHVAVALLNLARIHPGFGRSAAFRAGHRWVAAAARTGEARRPPARRARTRGAPLAAQRPSASVTLLSVPSSSRSWSRTERFHVPLGDVPTRARSAGVLTTS